MERSIKLPLLILGLLLLLGGGFYWFSLREVIARKECAKDMRDIAKNNKDSDLNLESMELAYRFCVHLKGVD